MKRLIIFFPIIFLAIILASCNDDDIDTKNSIFDDSIIQERNEFDKWLQQYFVNPYNIEVLYRFEDIQSSLEFDLIPAEIEKSKNLSIITRYLWVEPYDEALNPTFMRTYAPRILMYLGNPGWKNNNSIVLGTAEGGMKVILFNVNKLDIKAQSTYDGFIKTMHHEFAHILQQTKITDPAFDQITAGTYLSDNWTKLSLIEALRLGYLSTYSASSPIEDFVEIYSIFITSSPEYWESLLNAAATNADGSKSSGADFINLKFMIVYNYFQDSWGLDLYEMRDIMLRRKSEVGSLDLNTLYK